MMSVPAATDISAAYEQHQPELRVDNGAAAEEGVAVPETTSNAGRGKISCPPRSRYALSF